jgi:hypothetical protein
MKNQGSEVTRATHSVSIEVAKPPQEIFDCLIHHVSKFWPEELEGKCSKLNDEFVFKSGDSHYSKNKVIELVPNKRVVWLVTESIRRTDNFDWTGTRMIFELTSVGDNTILRFTYDGFVQKNESDRLVQICDTVIKNNLYSLLTLI